MKTITEQALESVAARREFLAARRSQVNVRMLLSLLEECRELHRTIDVVEARNQLPSQHTLDLSVEADERFLSVVEELLANRAMHRRQERKINEKQGAKK